MKKDTTRLFSERMQNELLRLGYGSSNRGHSREFLEETVFFALDGVRYATTRFNANIQAMLAERRRDEIVYVEEIW